MNRHPLAWSLLLLVTTATLVAAGIAHLWQHEIIAHRHNDRLQRVHRTAEDHLRDYRRLLATLRGIFLASEEVTADEWQVFLKSVGYPENYPGLSALGYVERLVPPADAPVFQNPPMTWPAPDPAASGVPEKAVLVYLTSRRHGFQTPGWDMRRFSSHWEAMQASLSRCQALLATPKGSPTLDQADAPDDLDAMSLPPPWVIEPLCLDNPCTWAPQTRGWVLATLDTQALVEHVQSQLPGITLRMPPEPWIAPEAVSAMAVRAIDDGSGADLLLPFAGKLLHLRVHADRSSAGETATSLPAFILVVGLLTAVTLATLAWSLVETRRRALCLAEQMTLDLRRREAETRKLALVAARTDHAVFICDHDQKIEWINAGFTRLTGLSLQEATGRRVNQAIVLDPRMDPEFLLDFRHRLDEGQTINVELPLDAGRDQPVWVSFDAQGVFDNQGQLTNVIGLMRDITERKTTEDRLLHQSLHDALTGLPNRLMLLDRLQQALRKFQRHPDRRFALIFLDLDRFKLINDSLGHASGDALLKTMAGRLTGALRAGDTVIRQAGARHTVARLGGDEFVVLLDDIADVADAIRIADRLQKEVSNPVLLDGQEVVTTASMGIALAHLGYAHPEDILRDADNAMYRAKSQGKARYQVFDRQMHEAITARLTLENELRKGIDRGEFLLMYQPMLCLESHRIVGFEALVRWRHPRRGLIAPEEFLPIAEETGLILPLGKWALLEACRQSMRWRARIPGMDSLSVGVNLSNRQLLDPDLGAVVGQVLRATGLDPRCLILEITESSMMQDPARMSQMLSPLKQQDVRLYMDDFGAGHSSLACLHRFPIDGLKIDRGFIHAMHQRSDYAAVVQAIVSLAHHLGMKVVAEGLENASQLLQLQTLEADQGQGSLFAMPMPADQVETFLLRADYARLSRAV